jgi:ligand-binding SRPBCC domain-containing protein
MQDVVAAAPPRPAPPGSSEIRLEDRDGTPCLVARQFLPRPRAEVFAFFQDPRNLARITPPWLNFCILRPEAVRMEVGARIDYTIRWLGLPLRWQTLITAYEPPHSFQDTQARGPYALWEHTHRFRETEGGTWVEDEVRFRVPLGPLGRVARFLLVDRQLRGIFEYRARTIQGLLAASPSGGEKVGEQSPP